MEKYTRNPNLPYKKVKNLFCSADISNEIYYNLLSIGINPIKLAGSDFFDDRLKNHPDMNCIHIKDNKWIFFNDYYKKNKNSVDKLGLEIIKLPFPEKNNYPFDIMLNKAVFGDILIEYNKSDDNLADKYFDDKIKLKVKQGYVKCSLLITGDNSFITSDKNMYESLIKNKKEGLLISAENIKLKGYENGLIGGCGGLIDKDKIILSGRTEKLPDHGKMMEFFFRNNINVIYLSDKVIEDFGSFLPVTEE